MISLPLFREGPAQQNKYSALMREPNAFTQSDRDSLLGRFGHFVA